MTACSSFAIRRFDLTEADWTEIVAPIACNYWGILYGPASMIRSSDPGDPSAWYECSGYALVAPRVGRVRFQPGDIVCYLKSGVGQGNAVAVVEFIAESI